MIDVKQDGAGAIVRYTRVATVNVYCPRIILQSAEARIRDKSPGDLVKTANPCAVNPRSLAAEVKRYPRSESVFEAISFGIVAECGPASVTLGLPMPQTVDLKLLGRENPMMARLWDLASEITDQAFGPKDIFHDRTDEDDLALQRAGESVVAEMVDGKYDVGLSAAVRGNVGEWRSAKFRDLLSGYKGLISANDQKVSYVPQLLNPQSYRFARFEAPKYPPLARQAHIEGKVELRLTLEPATGQVRDAVAVSGHRLLTPSAIDAAKQWIFVPESINSGSASVTLDFVLRCQ
ncbi:MAG TPA: energy transducer TonB [Bryobacteraceae bacterium]|nr:energy transducer TonB [Bryobacteraceae bacterium]